MDYSNYETREMRNKRVKEKIFDVSFALMKQIGADHRKRQQEAEKHAS